MNLCYLCRIIFIFLFEVIWLGFLFSIKLRSKEIVFFVFKIDYVIYYKFVFVVGLIFKEGFFYVGIFYLKEIIIFCLILRL